MSQEDNCQEPLVRIGTKLSSGGKQAEIVRFTKTKAICRYVGEKGEHGVPFAVFEDAVTLADTLAGIAEG